jgi:hypothetical protein
MEDFWANAVPGIDIELNTHLDPVELKNVHEQVEEYIKNLKRYLQAEGLL